MHVMSSQPCRKTHLCSTDVFSKQTNSNLVVHTWSVDKLLAVLRKLPHFPKIDFTRIPIGSTDLLTSERTRNGWKLKGAAEPLTRNYPTYALEIYCTEPL
jgi:hypothetical protein